MSADRWTTLDTLARMVANGASVATGGFMLGRPPLAMVFELIRQERRGLRLLSLPNPLPAEFLIAAGCVKRVEFPFGAISIAGRVRAMPCLKRAIEQRAIEWVEHDGYRVVQRLRAAAMGLPFIPAPDIEACGVSGLAPPRFTEDPFTGLKVPVEQAYSPDVALLHVHAADEQGNLFIEDPTTDLLIAGAARTVLATAETRVPRLSRVTIPSFQVNAVALAPGGALPAGCVGSYDYDEASLLAYLGLAEAGREAEWLRAQVFSKVNSVAA
jgi:glutaconate CoA-transferase subunit A